MLASVDCLNHVWMTGRNGTESLVGLLRNAHRYWNHKKRSHPRWEKYLFRFVHANHDWRSDTPAVKAFMQELEREVDSLCGSRYKHGKVNHRWGTQEGSIILANHHVAIEKPRVRSKVGAEVHLKTYSDFQDPRLFEEAVFTEGIKRVSQPGAFERSGASRPRLGWLALHC